MAAVLKHWREAATLILLCRTTEGSKVVMSKPVSSNKLKTSFDYRILLLKRSGKSKFMPNAYVFPGGTASDVDFSVEWSRLFHRSGTDLSKWPTALSSTVIDPTKLSPMLTRQRDKHFSVVPADVAFRICAIRETFEESGVLLVRNVSSSKLSEAHSKFTQKLPITASLCGELDEEALSEWRGRVQKDPSEFLKLCETYNVVPDVWSLYDWCNWLTPINRLLSVSGQKYPRRFDTAFYLCVLDEMPQFVKHDSGETVRTQWSTPAEVVQSFRAKTHWIAPPQLYEMARLIQFSTAREVAEFANKRSKYHMKRMMPVTVVAKDGILETFPGDCLFPEIPDWTTPSKGEREETLAELDNYSPKNRVELHGMFDIRLTCDVDQLPEHISPLSEQDLACLGMGRPSANL